MLSTRRVAVQLAQQGRRSFAASTQLPRIPDRRPNEAGAGGRASDAALKVAVFGASGFLGRYVCSELGTYVGNILRTVCVHKRLGSQIESARVAGTEDPTDNVIDKYRNSHSAIDTLGTNGVLAYLANRGDEMEMRHLKTQFDLGRSRFVFYSPRDRESMKEVIADADIVINMIGKYYESKAPYQTKSFPDVGYKTNYSFEDANVTIARTIAELCLELQVDNFIHISSAAADPDSPSEWARTKFAGEEAIKEVYPWATIVRPTQMFGAEDRFLNPIAAFAARYPFVPLVDGGHALTQPVFVADVGRAIARICDAPHLFEGKRVDCSGPADFSYKELTDFVMDITYMTPRIWDVPKDVALQLANIIQYQRNPPLTPDLVQLQSVDYLPAMTAEQYAAQNSKDAIITMDDLGVAQTPIEKVAFSYLHRYREGGHFDQVEGYH
jgi:NADH dehydrogenase (ubiquinone) 1 alpha subcomplex subunit 9